MSSQLDDIKAGIVVFLVALPLCLGIALASGAPLFAGIISGCVGGIVVALISRSPLSVSGPAAGLSSIILLSLTNLGTFSALLAAIVLAGIFQIALGVLKAGSIANFVPSAVIKGMLAAIGLLLILKQFPHAVGYDADFSGSESFLQRDGENTFSALSMALVFLHPTAILITGISLFVLISFESPVIKNNRFLKFLPGPLVVVVLGILINDFLLKYFPVAALGRNYMVFLPFGNEGSVLWSHFQFPDLRQWGNGEVWLVGLTIAVVASIESLLSIEAIDKLDPLKRRTPLNRELIAQGVGNTVCGCIGGLPVTSVIVRSSANVNAGAKSPLAAIIHGILLFVAVWQVPHWLNQIPLAALAGILLLVGYKLVKPTLIKEIYKQGVTQFAPFAITVVAILLTNMLEGMLVGISAGLVFLLRRSMKQGIESVLNKEHTIIRLTADLSFLHKAALRNAFAAIPDDTSLLIDASRTQFIDQDIEEVLQECLSQLKDRNISYAWEGEPLVVAKAPISVSH